jgi:O-antigen/teichoic acid export membrane protein
LKARDQTFDMLSNAADAGSEHAPSRGGRFARTAGALAILAALTLPVSYGRNWLLSHQPNGSLLLGAYAQLMILNQLVATFLVFGSASVFNHFVPKLPTPEQRGSFLLGNALLTGLCVTIACCVAMLAPGATRLAFGDLHPPREDTLLICGIVVVAASTVVVAAVGGLGHFKVVGIYENLFLLVPLLGLISVSGSAGVTQFVSKLGWIWVGWLLISSLVLFFGFVRPKCRFTSVGPKLPPGYWHFGGAIYLTTAITFMYQYFDQILISTFLSTAKLGEFFVVSQIAQLVVFVPQKLSQFTLHEFSKQSELASVERTYYRAATLSIWTVSAIAAIVIAGAPLVAKLFANTVTLEGERALILLAAGCSASALGALNAMLILSRRQTKLFIVNNLFLIAAQVAVNFVLIPRLGIQGAVLARTVAIALGQTGLYLIVRFTIFRSLKIPPSYWFCQGAIWAMALVPQLGFTGRAAIASIIALFAAMHFLKARKEDHAP